jgi:hypothetical protein
MLRKAAKLFGNNDPIGHSSQEFQEIKRVINAGPFSPLKKRIWNVYLDNWIDRIDNLGFFSTINLVMTAEQKKQFSYEMSDLIKRTDDEFLFGVKRLILTLSAESPLRKSLNTEIIAAEKELAERRASVHNAAKWAAIAGTLTMLCRDPTLGLLTLGIEVVVMLATDVGKLLDTALEIYDSTGYMDVERNGKVSRELMSSYSSFKNN